ncbi:MAG: hypothetical protein ACKVRP_07570 [Bacteroidota bacterium]
MKQLEYVLNNESEVLKFLKDHYPMYHLSNVFFRDIQYGVQTMLERRDMKVSYTDAETIARAFVQQLEKKKTLSPIDRQSWLLHYEEFRKPAAKPVAPAKPAAAAKPVPGAAAPRPAGGLPPLKSAAPVGVAESAPAPVAVLEAVAAPPAVAPVAAPPQPKPAAPVSTGGTIPPLGKRPLPPIKSSKPVGG